MECKTTEWPDGKTVKTVTAKNGDKAIALTGRGGNRLDPAGSATRAEVAMMLMRFVDVIVGQ